MAEIILTPHQQEQGDKVLELLRAGHKRIVLQGSAGCGKTVLASWLVKMCKKDHTVNTRYNNGMVFVTAPTNKALAVLMGKIDAAVEFRTIHSALRLKRYIDSKTGEEKFTRNNSSTNGKFKDEFPSAKLCIIDECSMLSKQFIGGYTDTKTGQFIPGYLDNLQIPIIFIGDEKQLNPVNEDYSPAFHQKDWPVVELTEIIRQGAGNPIIELSRDLDLIYFKQPKLVDGKGYIYNNDRAGIIDDLAEVNGTDEMKFLAWTNMTVDEMNKNVRQRRYGNPSKIEKLETIVFNSPFGEFYTNKEVKVEDLDIFVETVKVPTHDTRFDRDNQPISRTDTIKMKFYRINGVIDIVHEDSELIFKTISNNLRNCCKQQGWDWRGFFWFAEQFADIKYNHAISIHKSQGSTYKQTVIDIKDVDKNRNAAEKTRMLYTGVTRASHLLMLNNVGR